MLKCLNVSDVIHSSETGAQKFENVLPKFRVRFRSLRSWALVKLWCAVVTIPPSYAETLEAQSPTTAYLSDVNANCC